MRFDRTQHTVVAICWCGVREVCSTQDTADTWALGHIEKWHPAPDELPQVSRYMTAARKRRQRARATT